MAQKQSDPIQILANNIVDTMNTVATRRSDKAPFDKSYYATILGVNRKFTDDVSADDQTALIEKFALPETVEDGEMNYYIFKINGAYYCSKQNGDFKLYDIIMVYIPNGNWSNLYIDYPNAYSGGSGGSGTSLPNYTVSPDAPGGDAPNDGDLWIVVNDETLDEFTDITIDSFIKMYRFGTTEDEQVSKWRLVKTAVGRSSSCVDKDNDDYWIKLDEDEKTFLKICQWEVSPSYTTYYEIYPNAERGTTPALSISTKEPMKEGDYWVDIDNESDKNIESLQIYSFNEDELKYEWEVVFNVPIGTGGGVGENLAPYSSTAERFNDYSDIHFTNGTPDGGSVSTCPYDHLEGYHNYSIGSGRVSGGYITGAGGNSLRGEQNKAQNAICCDISGADNTVSGAYHRVSGVGHTVNGGYFNDVSGDGHTLNNCNGVAAVGGVGGTANNVEWSLVRFNGGTISNFYDSLISMNNGVIECPSEYGSTNLFVMGNSHEIYGGGGSLMVFGEAIRIGSQSSPSSLGVGNVFLGAQHSFNRTSSYTGGNVMLGWGAELDSSNDFRFVFGNGGNKFAIDSTGNVYAAGGYNSMGADYAETYEWLDGNPNGEDRRGMIVTLEGKYIRPADSNDDYILGIISSVPSICGDTYDFYWHGKYKTDIFGKPLIDNNGDLIISDEFDSEKVYIPQSKRPEKDYVGTTGKLVVIDDGTCIVNKYCKPSINGIGTYSENKSDFRVIERLDETHIKVVIK